MSIKVKTLTVIQNHVQLNCFVLKADIVYNRFAVSRRIEDKELGYQRSFSKKKIANIKKYLLEES